MEKMTLQQAFEFADKLSFFYAINNGSSINSTLLEYLGPLKYKQFCKNIKKVQRRVLSQGSWDPVKYFSENYVKNPVNIDDVLDDETIKKQWSYTSLVNEVKKLL